MNSFIIFIANVSAWFIKTFLNRTASTWPGHIALQLNSNIIREIISANDTKVVLIAGTNGKTTTREDISLIIP